MSGSSKSWSNTKHLNEPERLCSCSSPCVRTRCSADMQLFLDVASGRPPPCTFDTRSSACWEVFKKVFDIADKYDSAVVRERCEKWLVSRCACQISRVEATVVFVCSVINISLCTPHRRLLPTSSPLATRCLRGRVRCNDFKFQDLQLGLEWLGTCCKYNLRDLGWYVSYDLGAQLVDKTTWQANATESLRGEECMIEEQSGQQTADCEMLL